MARRGYKLQEFVAHSSNVNCLSIGKKACQLFVTGGDDHNVNLWTIGKPTSLTSLSGHASSVESVAFDSREISVLAGASSGIIKMWNLEEAKMVRTLSGHRVKCTAVEFHPFGELFASGSMDANLKIWDIRKKECIHTYRGHTQGISTIKVSPDGRWVVSGGFDNIVKVWDLTAGKLLHDFKFHVGHIRSIKFHPLEFLLATGSADKTVKFWDLETFELIGSTRPEAAELRAITFHPDGRALFAGLDEGLKVYSWEPMIRHDAVDMGWLTLGDLCIHDGKVLACSYNQNSVGVWVSDVSLIKPYGTDSASEQKDQTLQSSNLQLLKSKTSESIGAGLESYHLSSMPPDYETVDIKNIYVDTGGKPESPPIYLKQINNLTAQKPSPPTKLNDQGPPYLSVGHASGPEGKNLLNTQRGTVTFSKTKRGMLLKPAQTRSPPNNKLDFQRQATTTDSGTSCNTISSGMDSNFKTKDQIVTERTKKFSHEKKSELLPPPVSSDHQNCNESTDCIKDISSVKTVNGVTVISGRTRTLVEKFEKREGLNGIGVQETQIYSQTPDSVQTISTSSLVAETEKTSTVLAKISPVEKYERKEGSNGIGVQEFKTSSQTSDCVREINTSSLVPEIEQASTLQFSLVQKFERREALNGIRVQEINTSSQTVDSIREISTSSPALEIEKTPTLQVNCTFSGNLHGGESQMRDLTSSEDKNTTEDLMHSHDVFLSSLRSRMTKLQVVRHFWVQKDIKGALNALTKLPDHSVQADVISVLSEKMDILSLDLLTYLLPVLTHLLDSKTERHVTTSLEMTLKVVAVFYPVVRTIISAPRGVRVDLQAEQRLQRSNQCFIQIQKIQKILPSLVKKGGVTAKCAEELSILLEQS